MRKKPRSDWEDDDKPLIPELHVYESRRGLEHPIGFVRWWNYRRPAKRAVRRKKVAAKRK